MFSGAQPHVFLKCTGRCGEAKNTQHGVKFSSRYMNKTRTLKSTRKKVTNYPVVCHHMRKGITMSLSRNRDVARAEHVQNGEGHMYRDLLLTEDQIHGELTYVSSITLEPGCSIGVHTHSGDNEMYYIYEGTGTYTDGDETYPVQAGDVLFCNDGETHGIANEGNAPLRFVALMQATA